ncbi:MAG TPA: hypothetical protein VIE63_00440 [Ramlibacter sp.]
MPKEPPPEPLSDLRVTAPSALEKNSETAWAEFQSLREAGEQEFEPTRAASGVLPLQSSEPSGAAPAAAGSEVTLDAALSLARQGNRVCPLPGAWKKLSELLQQLAPPGTVPPFPIDGQAWNIVSPMEKRVRLRDQLEWASRFGLLGAAVKFLQAMPEKSWLHF